MCVIKKYIFKLLMKEEDKIIEPLNHKLPVSFQHLKVVPFMDFINEKQQFSFGSRKNNKGV